MVDRIQNLNFHLIVVSFLDIIAIIIVMKTATMLLINESSKIEILYYWNCYYAIIYDILRNSTSELIRVLIT